MAFIDDLKQGFSDVTKTVYEKSEQFVGVQKLRLKKNSLNSELKASYIEIGKMVYEEQKAGGEFSGPVVQLCQKIDMGLEAIQEVEAQIEEAKAKSNVDDDFDLDDIFEDEVEEAETVEETATVEEAVEEAAETIAEAEEAVEEAEEAVAEAEVATEEAEEIIEEAEKIISETDKEEAE
jgi:flagellar biosynthesis regulator FlaF